MEYQLNSKNMGEATKRLIEMERNAKALMTQTTGQKISGKQ